MMRGLVTALAVLALPASAGAQYIGGNAPPPPLAPLPGYAESPGAALARNVRLLAINPRNYEALVGAGKAALATGDAETAVGFYGRAEELNPRSWVPKIGQGAALVQMGDPGAALRAFADAGRLGASTAALALDRGLAYDLSGDQPRAQADYRVALGGMDGSEARRRLALSLAISGKRMEALGTLDPLLARRDPGALRARAFVLALTGDVQGARSAVSTALPGLAGTMDPFLRRLATLRPADKAAAVHLGVMPGSGFAPPPPTSSYAAVASPLPQSPADRLADIDQLLAPSTSTLPTARGGSVPAPPAAGSVTNPPPGVRIASATPRPAAAVPARSRHWVQLASGRDSARFPDQFRRLTSRNKDVFIGLTPFVAEEPDRARLLIGPFKSVEDARTFADDLASVSIDAFNWTSAPGQAIRKLPQ